MPTPVQTARGAVEDVAQWDRGHEASGEAYPWDEYGYLLAALDPYGLDAALLEVARIKRACDQVAAQLRANMIADVEAEGPVRIGSTVYATVPDRQRKVTDPQGLAEWLGEHWAQAVRIDASNVRITTVRQIAALRGQDPQAVEDTFFAWEGEGQRRLQPYRVDGKETPRWAQQLAEGERRKP